MCLCLLGGCAPANAPSHVPPLVLLPAAAISHALQEAPYRARRAEVVRFVTPRQEVICAEIAAGNGPTLQQAMRLARIPPGDHEVVAARLANDPTLCSGSADALIVALMVHGR